MEEIAKVNEYATEGTFPDLTLFFDLDPEIGLKRIAENSGREVNRLDLEKMAFHQKVRESFQTLAKRYSDRYVVIDASKPLEEVVQNVYETIESRL